MKLIIEHPTKHPLYNAWKKMKDRCANPKATQYRYYGAKGISVCGRWRSFPDFVLDVGCRPTALHSLDRINPLGDYEPGNVRWATKAEQNRNRSNCQRTFVSGYGEMCGAEAARLFGMDKSAYYRRVKA